MAQGPGSHSGEPSRPSKYASRSELEIRMDILRAVGEGAESLNQVMYKADLSNQVLSEQLDSLTEQGFVERKETGNKIHMSLTQKGVEMIGAYLNLIREIVVNQAWSAETPGPVRQTSKPNLSESFREAFGIDGQRAIQVARMINKERHKKNA